MTKADSKKRLVSAFLAVFCVLTALALLPSAVFGADGGDLVIKKQCVITETYQRDVLHRMQEFVFTVTINDISINGPYGDVNFTDGVGTVNLKDDESATIVGLPAGAIYRIECAAVDGWLEPTWTNQDGTIIDAEIVAVVTTKLNPENWEMVYDTKSYLLHNGGTNVTDGSVEVGDTVTTMVSQSVPAQPGICGMFGLHTTIPWYYTLHENSVRVEAVNADGSTSVLTEGADYLLEVNADIDIALSNPNLPAAFKGSTIKILYYKSSFYMPPALWDTTENLSWYKNDPFFEGGRTALNQAVRVNVYFDETLNGQAVTGGYMVNRSLSTQVLDAPNGDRFGRGQAISNYSYLGGISAAKTDEAGNPLSGAEFALYASEADAIEHKNPVSVKESGADGIVTWEQLTYGLPGQTKDGASRDYYIREVSAPDDYLLPETVFKVSVTQDTHNLSYEELLKIENKKIPKIPPDSPKTGDDAGTELYTALTMAGFTGLLLSLKYFKIRNCLKAKK